MGETGGDGERSKLGPLADQTFGSGHEVAGTKGDEG